MRVSTAECGAIGDGRTVDTEALQAAICACASSGGGQVVVEPGTYLTGTLQLHSNVELHLSAGAVLQGSTDPADYTAVTSTGFVHENAPEGNSKALLCACEAENVAVTGAGEINGCGPAFYDTDIPDEQRHYAKPPVDRPRMVLMYDCRNVVLEGVSFVDCPCWTVWLIACENVSIRRVQVRGDQRMINNDGIDIDSCRNVTISDSLFATGDDCIVVRAIQPVLEREAVCERVTVTNCVLDSLCQGIRVGCPSDGTIRNCVFSNLVIDGQGTGINIDNPKRYLMGNDGGMDLRDIQFSNIRIRAGRWPFRIWVEEGVRLRNLSDIVFADIRATSRKAPVVCGSAETAVSDVRLCNVAVEADEDEEGIVARHCRRLTMDAVQLTFRVARR